MPKKYLPDPEVPSILCVDVIGYLPSGVAWYCGSSGAPMRCPTKDIFDTFEQARYRLIEMLNEEVSSIEQAVILAKNRRYEARFLEEEKP